MAEQVPIAAKFEHKREILLLVVLGFGSLVYSFGTMAMYAEPEARPITITLQARARTEPRGREALAGASADTRPAPATAAPETLPAPAAAPAAAPASAAAPAKPAGAAPETVPASATPPVQVPASTAAPAAIAPPAPRVEAPSSERVRIQRRLVDGKWIEVHDFTHGVDYRGPVHDFRSGQVPRWIREEEQRAGGARR